MAQNIRWKFITVIIGRWMACRSRSCWRRGFFQWGVNALRLRDTPVPPEKIVIDKVVVNPKMEEKLFSKTEVPSVAKSK